MTKDEIRGVSIELNVLKQEKSSLINKKLSSERMLKELETDNTHMKDCLSRARAAIDTIKAVRFQGADENDLDLISLNYIQGLLY